MDSKNIEALLEKYWNAETTLEEERELQEFFKESNFPENLADTAALFRYFEAEKAKKLNENFDTTVTKQVQARHGGKIVDMTNWFRVARIAAGVIVVVASIYLVGQEVRKSGKNIDDTESDPKLAFEETKKALLMISKNFNKAQREASRINLLNEAEQKIQRKPIENEKEQKKVSI